jgi:predicted Fe-S protein YdhL (DUF1289 family)|tara:strand:- start:544 stop:750 length:207 start_codon:yes stop_codon:yes gene_type:complete
MSEASITKFISQCVAESPCVGKDDPHCKMNEAMTACVTCKRTLAEISGWDTATSFEEREKVCKELLDR